MLTAAAGRSPVSAPRGIRLRGYRRVFRVERRLFRFDRWRIPYPHGIPLRGIGYFLGLELCVVALMRLPLLGALLGLLPPALLYLAAPLAGAIVLMRGRIDGRPPHQALFSLVRFWLGPHWFAGLSPCPPPGQEVMALEQLTVAHDARESFHVRGRIRGPATVTFRYAGAVRPEGAPPWLRDKSARAARARRYRVRRAPGDAQMLHGKTLRVPSGRKVVVE